MNKNIITINVCGGPGIGKTSICYSIINALEQLGLKVEFDNSQKELYKHSSYCYGIDRENTIIEINEITSVSIKKETDICDNNIYQCQKCLRKTEGPQICCDITMKKII